MPHQPSGHHLAILHSLRFKASFFMALVMTVVVLVLSGAFLASEQSKGAQEILTNAQTFANFSTQTIYDNYAQYYTHPQKEEFEQFKTRIQKILDLNPDITGVSLLGISGRVLFDSSEFKDGKYKGDPRVIDNETTLKNLQSEDPSHVDIKTDSGERATEIIVPLNEAGIGHVLSVRYVASYASLAKRTAELLLQTIVLAIPLMILVIIVAIVFAMRLTKPLVKLTDVAGEIRGGNFDAKSDIKSNDEIGVLSSTIDDMARQLKQTYTTLEREKARFSASIDSLPLGFMLTDATGTILIANPSIHHMIDINSPDGKALFAQLQPKARVCLEKKQPLVIPEISQGGRNFRALLSPVLLSDDPDSPAIGTAILLEDITEERILTRSKDEFFSIASHELRTPLTAIRGNTRMILDYFSDAIKDNQLKDMIGDIHGSSVRLIEIVNDFLDASRLEQGKMEFKLESFSLASLVKTTIEEVNTIAKSKGVELRVDQSIDHLPPLWADQNKTKQVLYNLLGNALKFVEKGSVTLSAETSTKLVKIFVNDTGKGMPLEAQQLLFHKFQQATGNILTRDDTRGTGLGLYISKLLIENMGGQIKLEHSEVGKGSTFSFTLPIDTGEHTTTLPANPVETIKESTKTVGVAPSAKAPASAESNTPKPDTKPEAKPEPAKEAAKPTSSKSAKATPTKPKG